MSKLLEPGSTSASATVEYIDPFDNPLSYGVDLLQLQLEHVEPVPDAVRSATTELGAAAARKDITAVREFSYSIGSWWHRDPPHEILETGKETLAVPVLLAAAPEVTDVSVKAT